MPHKHIVPVYVGEFLFDQWYLAAHIVSTIMCYTDTTMNTIKASTITGPIHRHLLFWLRIELGQRSQNGPYSCFSSENLRVSVTRPSFQWLFQIKSGEQSVLGAFDVEAIAGFAHVPTAWRDTNTQTVPKLHKKQVPQTTFITYRILSLKPTDLWWILSTNFVNNKDQIFIHFNLKYNRILISISHFLDTTDSETRPLYYPLGGGKCTRLLNLCLTPIIFFPVMQTCKIHSPMIQRNGQRYRFWCTNFWTEEVCVPDTNNNLVHW